jgi:hypothetical protein
MRTRLPSAVPEFADVSSCCVGAVISLNCSLQEAAPKMSRRSVEVPSCLAADGKRPFGVRVAWGYEIVA